MAKSSSLLSQALSSYTATPSEEPRTTQIRFNIKPKRKPLDERSANSHSQPIKMPRPDLLPYDLPADWKPAPAKIHHKRDNITDYCLPGTNFWEAMQMERVAQSEKDIGRILEGAWPPREMIHPVRVVRKDVDFRMEERLMYCAYWGGESLSRYGCGSEENLMRYGCEDRENLVHYDYEDGENLTRCEYIGGEDLMRYGCEDRESLTQYEYDDGDSLTLYDYNYKVKESLKHYGYGDRENLMRYGCEDRESLSCYDYDDGESLTRCGDEYSESLMRYVCEDRESLARYGYEDGDSLTCYLYGNVDNLTHDG